MESHRTSLAPRDIFRILFRHKWKSCLVFATTMILVVIGLVVCPRTYVSEAKLFVKIGRESVGLDPTATVGATVAIQDSRESEIRSVMDLLDSRVMRERVVAVLGPQPILTQSVDVDAPVKSSGFDLKGLIKQSLTWLLPEDHVSDDEQAIRILEKSIEVESGKKSNVVTIRCKSGSPLLSKKIVDLLLEAYRNEHVAVNSNDSYKFFEKQAEILRGELLTATEELSHAKSELGLTSIDGQREILEAQINNLNKELSDLSASISASDAKIGGLRTRLKGIDETTLPSGTGLTQTAIDQMRDTLYQLQIREREMQSKYQLAHPAYTALRQQVEEVEGILTRQEMLIEMANAGSLRARQSALSNNLTEAQNKFRLLNQNEVSISQLERRVELLRASFRTYSEKAEQSRVAQALDDEQLTNLKVVQPATLVAKAVSPKASVVLLLGAFVAASGGLALALLFEFFDHSFQTPEQIESQLRVPVLMAIPYLKHHDVAAN